MRNRFLFLLAILDYLGALFWIFGFVLLVPLAVLGLHARADVGETSAMVFILPATLAFSMGALLKRKPVFRPLENRSAMLLCVAGWVAISALGAIPLWLGLRIGYLDAFFESVSGFTTTGITMLHDLSTMPRSILFWRSLMQWLGGLGILTFFLTLMFTTGAAHSLYRAESHKIFSKRPAPGLFHTLRILWSIYAAFTVLAAVVLYLEGLSVFDAVTHALTSLSTGGYSPHDKSIAYYQQAGYRHFAAIEYTVVFFMLLGGINFFIHYRVLSGGFRALWDNFEMKLFWLILAGAVALVAVARFTKFGFGDAGGTVRHSIFQVVAIMTSSGFATKDIGSGYFPPLAQQIFLILMVIGGCVGSTAGGIKVMRIGVLLKLVVRQIKHVVHGRASVNPILVDGDIVDPEEIQRIAALFFAWIVLLAFGAGVTALLTEYGPLASASGMFSALGNIGPCYIPAEAMSELPPLVKITYILGMLAGRLEILPVLLLFSRRTWR